MVIYQGEEFDQYIGGDCLDFNDCSQIVVSIFNADTKKTALVYVKVPDAELYPDAGEVLISETTDYKIKVRLASEDTQKMCPGNYNIEVKRIFTDSTDIYKDQVAFCTVKKTSIA